MARSLTCIAVITVCTAAIVLSAMFIPNRTPSSSLSTPTHTFSICPTLASTSSLTHLSFSHSILPYCPFITVKISVSSVAGLSARSIR